MKATLNGRQVLTAIFAGIVGHFFFSVGWTTLWLAAAGGALTGILGLTLEGFAREISSGADLGTIFDNAGGVIGGVLIGIVIGSVIVLVLAFLFSGWILKGGKVRKPWATTFTSMLIAAVVSLPLFLLYIAIAGSGDGGAPYALVAFLGTIIVGVLIWLWMTWAHRGPAPESAVAVEAPTSTPPAIPQAEAPAGAQSAEPEAPAAPKDK